MICVQQWRAAIGSWYNVTHQYFLNTFTDMKSPIFKYKIRNYLFISVLCVSLSLFCETQCRHSVKVRLYNTPSPILHSVKRRDVTR